MANERRYYDRATRTFLPGARIHVKQYKILKRCAKADGDISEWQQYRDAHPDEAIWLCGAPLRGVVLKSPAYDAWRKDHEPRDMTSSERWILSESGDVLDLRGAHLDGADLFGADLDGADLREAHLDGAYLPVAHLDGAYLREAHLDGAKLWRAHLDGAVLFGADLDGATLRGAHLDGAVLWSAHLDGADLSWAHLDGAVLTRAHLDGADLSEAHLDGANLTGCAMRGTDLRMASVGGETVLKDCEIDRQTDATGVPLDAARVEPGLRQLLEYNVRRLGWERWYDAGPWWLRVLKRVIVRAFWQVSDYGLSTGRILAAFVLLSLGFANLYEWWGFLDTPGIVSGLFEVDGHAVPCLIIPLRAAYFSVVTMTTLGFGDLFARAHEPWGHVFLSIQVILGYVLLGALVTRFAVLFSAGGPPGRFSPKPKKKRRGKET